MVLTLTACQRESPTRAIERIQPPPDLAQLEQGVRGQFERYWRAVADFNGEFESKPAMAARVWGELGMWLDVYGYKSLAASAYQNATRLDPAEPRWPYFLGRLTAEAGNLDQAQKYFLQARGASPDTPAPLVQLANLALQRADLQTAEDMFQQVLTRSPHNVHALFGGAKSALLKNQPAKALRFLQPLAEMQPHAADVRYALASAYRQLGRSEEADRQLRDIPASGLEQILLRGTNPWEQQLSAMNIGSRSLTRQAVRASRRGKLKQALRLFARATHSNPTSALVHVNYASALTDAGAFPAAVRHLDEALSLAGEGTPAALSAHMAYGRLHLKKADFAQAAVHFQKILKYDPESISAHIQLAKLYQRKGEYADALRQYDWLVEHAEHVSGVQFWHAIVLLRLNREQDALASLEKSLAVNRDDIQLKMLLARMLVAPHDGRFVDIEKAARIVKDRPATSDVFIAETAAMVASANGDFAEAMKLQQAALARLEQTAQKTQTQIARRRLILYKTGKHPRRPWVAGEQLVTYPIDDAR